jgi:hypothetical protein
LHLHVDATITIDHSDNKQNALRVLLGPTRDRRR